MKKYENVKTKKQTLIFYSKKEEKTKKYVKIDYQNFIKIRKC